MKTAALALVYASGSVALAKTVIPAPVSTACSTSHIFTKTVYDTAVHAAQKDAHIAPQPLRSAPTFVDADPSQHEQTTDPLDARAATPKTSFPNESSKSKNAKKVVPTLPRDVFTRNSKGASHSPHTAKPKVSRSAHKSPHATSKTSKQHKSEKPNTAAQSLRKSARDMLNVVTTPYISAQPSPTHSSPLRFPIATPFIYPQRRSSNWPANITVQRRDLHDVYQLAAEQGYFELSLVVNGYDVKLPILEPDAKAFCERIQTEKPVPAPTPDVTPPESTSKSEKEKTTKSGDGEVISTGKKEKGSVKASALESASTITSMKENANATTTTDGETTSTSKKKKVTLTNNPETTAEAAKDVVENETGVGPTDPYGLPPLTFPSTTSSAKKAHRTAAVSDTEYDVRPKMATRVARSEAGKEGKEPMLVSWCRTPLRWLRRWGVDDKGVGKLETRAKKQDAEDVEEDEEVSSTSIDHSAISTRKSKSKSKSATAATTSATTATPHKSEKTANSDDEESESPVLTKTSLSSSKSKPKATPSSPKKTTSSEVEQPTNTRSTRSKPTPALGLGLGPTSSHHASTTKGSPDSDSNGDDTDTDSDTDSEDLTTTTKPSPSPSPAQSQSATTTKNPTATDTSAAPSTSSTNNPKAGHESSGAEIHHSNMPVGLWVIAGLVMFWVPGLLEFRNQAWGHVEWGFVDEALRNRGIRQRDAFVEKV
ncbi:hypothetical protein P280DRAFT_478269 [Massarina eburnea CBS 473.64]|uniref:Uncharacterized protein n=1 Tax=Massarina eburnea CBS 473.64 TaxID=1395130 RepID=A0A6A6S7E7_9PLEO|nr:hypothetical protein P280DRAFT_478269 [Massarina eburnea CBS 473.64]